MKKLLISVLLVMVIICSVSGSTSVKAKSIVANEAETVTYCQKFIRNMVTSGGTSAWKNDTKPAQIIETYNIYGNINAYIINLQTDGHKSGYVFAEVYGSSQPDISEYGFDGEYRIDAETAADFYNGKKLIYAGNKNFFYEDGDSLYIAGSKDKTKFNRQKILKYYKNEVKIKTDAEGNKSDAVISPNGKTSSGTLKSYKYLPNIAPFTPYTMKHYNVAAGISSGAGTCVEACASNMLLYWNKCRNIHDLFINGSAEKTFKSFLEYMKYNGKGTDDYCAYTGMASYISESHVTASKGHDYKSGSGISWSYIEKNINNGNALAVGADCSFYDSKYSGWHAFLAVGYQNTTSGQYIRVVDEWDNSDNHYYKYVHSHIKSVWYYRW